MEELAADVHHLAAPMRGKDARCRPAAGAGVSGPIPAAAREGRPRPASLAATEALQV